MAPGYDIKGKEKVIVEKENEGSQVPDTSGWNSKTPETVENSAEMSVGRTSTRKKRRKDVPKQVPSAFTFDLDAFDLDTSGSSEEDSMEDFLSHDCYRERYD